jgi:hypothetical protein
LAGYVTQWDMSRKCKVLLGIPEGFIQLESLGSHVRIILLIKVAQSK